MKPILETKSTYKGYPYVVLFMPGAYRCGYVGIPDSHKLARKSIDDLGYLDCHGGLDLTALIVSMVMILRQQNSISGKNQTSKKCLK